MRRDKYSWTERAAWTPVPTAVAICLGQASETSPAAKSARDRRLHVGVDLDLLPFVELEKSLDESCLGLGPDRDEEARNGQGGSRAVLEVADGERLHFGGALDAVDDGVQQDADLPVGGHPLLVDLLAAELVPAVDEGQRPGEPGQEEGLFQGVVPAADDGDVAPGEKGPVAGGAIGDAGAGQAFFARNAQPPIGRARGQDDGPGLVISFVPFENERLAGS